MSLQTWVLASFGLIVVLLVLTVFLPVTNAILPLISSSMGSTVSMLISSMVLLIVAGTIYSYWVNSTATNNSGGV